MPSKKEVENLIVSIMRQHFLKYSHEVLEKYSNQINSLVRWYISSLPRHIAQHEADDLASEARIAFLGALKNWDPRQGDLWPYVSFRLKGSMKDYLRKRGNDPIAGMYEWIVSAAEVYMAFKDKNPHHNKIDQVLHVENAMKCLTEKEREVIEGYYQKDKTFKNLGKEVGLSESQVSRICKEATQKMRKFLDKKDLPSDPDILPDFTPGDN